VFLYQQQYPNGYMVKEATEKTPALRVTNDRLRTYLDLLHAHYINTQFILAEHSVTLEVHYGKYRLIISWWLDLVTSWYCVVDLKTSGSERKEEGIKQKLQKIIYLYAMYKATGKEDIWFEYPVLRTDLKVEKNIKLQTVRTELDIPAFEYLLDKLIGTYLYSYEHNVYTPKQGDSCRYCKLWPKWNKQCPVFSEEGIHEAPIE
jgi:hypothetical protein